MKNLELILLIVILSIVGLNFFFTSLYFIWKKRWRIQNFKKPIRIKTAILKSLAIKLTDAVQELSATKTGALIVLEKKTNLSEFYNLKLDADVEPLLLVSLFKKESPLHDGAIIINNNKIASVSCYLPNSNSKIDNRLGSRHRAALGMSEVSDALVIVVSETSGNISYAYSKELKVLNNSTELVNLILKCFSQKRKAKKTRG